MRSAPWHSSVAKAAVKAQIEQIAAAAAPDVTRAIQSGLPVSFTTMMSTALVRNVDAPGAAAFSEMPDTFGLLCWIAKDQMLAKISAAIDEVASDKSALSKEQREEMEAQITSEMLKIERAECSLIWHAEADGEVFDFRSDTDPRAVLGIDLVAIAPRVAAGGSSWQHALDIVGR